MKKQLIIFTSITWNEYEDFWNFKNEPTGIIQEDYKVVILKGEDYYGENGYDIPKILSQLKIIMDYDKDLITGILIHDYKSNVPIELEHLKLEYKIEINEWYSTQGTKNGEFVINKDEPFEDICILNKLRNKILCKNSLESCFDEIWKIFSPNCDLENKLDFLHNLLTPETKIYSKIESLALNPNEKEEVMNLINNLTGDDPFDPDYVKNLKEIRDILLPD